MFFRSLKTATTLLFSSALVSTPCTVLQLGGPQSLTSPSRAQDHRRGVQC